MPVPPYASVTTFPFHVPVAIVPKAVMFKEPAQVERAVFSTLPKPNEVLAVLVASVIKLEPLPIIK